jgi:hypothetical protein
VRGAEWSTGQRSGEVSQRLPQSPSRRAPWLGPVVVVRRRKHLWEVK